MWSKDKDSGCCDGAVRAAWNDYYGGALPLKIKKGELAGSPLAVFAAAFCGGLVTFFVTIVLFNFGLFFHSTEVVGLAEAGLLGCLALILNHRRRHLATRSPLLVPTAVCCAVAIIWGALLGTYSYDGYGYFAFIYSNSRVYHNVVPSENAAAMADAGRLVFAPEAWVDTSKAAGYSPQSGDRYCAAPIRGLEEPRRVEFWAVGRGCCGELGTFTCGAALGSAPNNSTASSQDDSGGEHGGVIVFDNHGIFGTSDKDQYAIAREKAEANGQLIKAEDYIYVHWVTLQELEAISAQSSQHCWLFIGLATVFYAVASIPFAWLMSNNTLKQRGF